MSLAIDTNAVTAVLLVDGWHLVEEGSFVIDAYEFTEGPSCFMVHSGGNAGVCGTGFTFVVPGSDGALSGGRMAGPLTAVLAVRYL